MTSVPQCYFCCKIDEEYDTREYQISFQFDRGEGKPRADAYYDSTHEEKAYVRLLVDELRLPESMENTYDIPEGVSKNEIVARLRAYGLELVDKWW